MHRQQQVTSRGQGNERWDLLSYCRAYWFSNHPHQKGSRRVKMVSSESQTQYLSTGTTGLGGWIDMTEKDGDEVGRG
jgi:hypothetical protein